MGRLYEELDEPCFSHDFDNAVHGEPDCDRQLGMPGLHKVRQKVEYEDRKPCFLPEVFAESAGLNFWLKPELNTYNKRLSRKVLL